MEYNNNNRKKADKLIVVLRDIFGMILCGPKGHQSFSVRLSNYVYTFYLNRKYTDVPTHKFRTSF